MLNGMDTQNSHEFIRHPSQIRELDFLGIQFNTTPARFCRTCSLAA